MENVWESAVVNTAVTAEEALQVMNAAALRIALVVDDDNHLVGVLTDGDIRRGLLNHIDFSRPVSDMMNKQPLKAVLGTKKDKLRQMMESRSVLHIPLVDENDCLVGLETLQHLLSPPTRENWVFLMAGGFGTRLSPLTDKCPKPLLLVGGKPILQSILESFIEAGFRKFFISVYYMAEQIKAYFGDGSRWEVTIIYVEEDAPLGTAGALGLLPETIDTAVVMMNGDVVTRLDFNALLDFHERHQAKVTLCVREYDMEVPFGVVEGEDSFVTSIVEKPVHRFFVNAGVYVVSPEAIQLTRPAKRLDMPDLVSNLLADSGKVAKFPIYEYWLDIGRPDDFKRAQRGVTPQ